MSKFNKIFLLLFSILIHFPKTLTITYIDPNAILTLQQGTRQNPFSSLFFALNHIISSENLVYFKNTSNFINETLEISLSEHNFVMKPENASILIYINDKFLISIEKNVTFGFENCEFTSKNNSFTQFSFKSTGNSSFYFKVNELITNTKYQNN